MTKKLSIVILLVCLATTLFSVPVSAGVEGECQHVCVEHLFPNRISMRVEAPCGHSWTGQIVISTFYEYRYNNTITHRKVLVATRQCSVCFNIWNRDEDSAIENHT